MPTETRYEITVWNLIDGDIAAYRREATEEELADIETWYGGDAIHDIVIDNEWEVEVELDPDRMREDRDERVRLDRDLSNTDG